MCLVLMENGKLSLVDPNAVESSRARFQATVSPLIIPGREIRPTMMNIEFRCRSRYGDQTWRTPELRWTIKCFSVHFYATPARLKIMNTHRQHSGISSSDIARYEREGYIKAPVRLSSTTLEAIQSSYREMCEEHPDMNLDFVPSPHVPNFVPGLINCQPWLDYAVIPEVLDSVEALIGPDFLMWGSAIFGKPGVTGKATPMHQDGEYWPIKPLASVTVWIALDDAGPENGCLRVVPGSHRSKQLYSHRRDDDPAFTLNQVVDDPDARLDESVDVCLEAGEFSIHDVHLLHGSAPNTSPHRRAGLTYRYMPTTSHFDHEWAGEMARTMGTTDMSDRTLYLVRGNDACGKNDFSAGSENRLNFT